MICYVDAESPEARRTGQDAIPCHIHAMTALQFAVARGDEWITVRKPGHTCEYNVVALRAHMNAHPAAVPRCLVKASPAEHRALGSWLDPFTRNWPGADFAAPFGRR